MSVDECEDRVRELEIELGRARRELAAARKLEAAHREAAVRQRMAAVHSRITRRCVHVASRLYRMPAEDVTGSLRHRSVEARRFAWWLANEFGVPRSAVAAASGANPATVNQRVWEVKRDVSAGRGPWLDLLRMTTEVA